MSRERRTKKIARMLSQWVSNIEGLQALGMLDQNRVAEDHLVPLLRAVYGWRSLKNLNEEQENFPGLDLGDKVARVGVQVSSTRTSDKVKKTLRTVLRHNLDQYFDRVIIYLLTYRQETYSDSAFDEIVDGRLSFDSDTDIIDFRNVLGELKRADSTLLLQVERVVEAIVNDEMFAPLDDYLEELEDSEEVVLNLVPITPPSTIYAAPITMDRDAVRHRSKQDDFGIKLRYRSAQRRYIQAALEQKGTAFASCFYCYNGVLYTFHDLRDNYLPLRHVIDTAAVELHQISELTNHRDLEIVVKRLVNLLMKDCIYKFGVIWQHEVQQFFFKLNNSKSGGAQRSERWGGKSGRQYSRMVAELLSEAEGNEDDQRALHLSFSSRPRKLGDKWFLQINPDWFISYDGYRKSKWLSSSRFIANRKRMEFNRSIYNHVRFIANFIKRAAEDEESSGPTFLVEEPVSLTATRLAPAGDEEEDDFEN